MVAPALEPLMAAWILGYPETGLFEVTTQHPGNAKAFAEPAFPTINAAVLFPEILFG